MGFFSRKPQLKDEELIELADMFRSPIIGAWPPTLGSEILAKLRLNYTLESLAGVDDYLEKMKDDLDIVSESDYTRMVLRCGAYVGEVVRRQSRGKQYHWLDYEGGAKVQKSFADLGMCLGTMAVLWDGADDEICFPVAKVEKFLMNGRQDSAQFFAKMMIERSG